MKYKYSIVCAIFKKNANIPKIEREKKKSFMHINYINLNVRKVFAQKVGSENWSWII